MERQYKVTGLDVGGLGVLLSTAFQFQVYPLFLIIPPSIIASLVIHSERGAIFNIAEYICHLEKELISKYLMRGKLVN